MVRTSRTIHRINVYIHVSTSIACTNSTTPHDSSWGFFLYLFFFAAVVIADFFLSILVAFFAVDSVIVVPPFSYPPSLLSLLPSSYQIEKRTNTYRDKVGRVLRLGYLEDEDGDSDNNERGGRGRVVQRRHRQRHKMQRGRTKISWRRPWRRRKINRRRSPSKNHVELWIYYKLCWY